MTVTSEEYESLKQKGVETTVLEEEKPREHARIGMFLRQNHTRETDCASDRIRGEWLLSDEIEEWREGRNYEASIYHVPEREFFRDNGEIKILDVSDPFWRESDKWREALFKADGITVSTQGLKDEIKKINKDANVRIIEDRHDLSFYETRKENQHKKTAKNVVWFGYSANFNCVLPFQEFLEKNKLNLTTITEKRVAFGKFVKWKRETFVEEISKADFALLPHNGNLKSNNKDITAYLCGIPVAKTEADIRELMNPKHRQLAVKKGQAIAREEYDAKISTKQMLDFIESLKKDVTIYTAITGGYEKDNGEVKTFTDDPADTFKHPNLNAKKYKILAHKYIKSKYSVWIDGNIRTIKTPKEIVALLENADIAVFKHPQRENIYEEAKPAGRRAIPNTAHLIEQQTADYRNEGLPESSGLYECGIIIRKHSPKMEAFNEKWWAEVCRYSNRDQMSFPYVLWKMPDVKLKVLGGNLRHHPYFRYENHK